MNKRFINTKYLGLGALLFSSVLLTACDSPEAVISCDAVGELKAICGFQNPEDIESLGDGETLVVSQMGRVGQFSPGSIAFYNTKAKHLKIFPAFTDASQQSWGQPSCTPPGKALSPHGIHLRRIDDKRQRLLVVNHGDRESVEAFDIHQHQDGHSINWVGCVQMPENSFINDVVADNKGGFYTSHMFEKEGLQLGLLNWPQLKGVLGFKTGWVWHWQPNKAGGQFSKLGDFKAAFTNGLQLDAKGEYLYVNAWGNHEVHKLKLPEGEVVKTIGLSYPDNINWSDNGRLLVASQQYSFAEMQLCMELQKGACPASFSIVELDPETLEITARFDHGGAPMGAATVAQTLGDYVYLGTFAGDRMVRLPKAEFKR